MEAYTSFMMAQSFKDLQRCRYTNIERISMALYCIFTTDYILISHEQKSPHHDGGFFYNN
jgi:hypothetical protein